MVAYRASDVKLSWENHDRANHEGTAKCGYVKEGLELETDDEDEYSSYYGYGNDMVLIAVTGWSRDDRRVAETFDRVDHYLQKPIEADVIRSLLPPIDD